MIPENFVVAGNIAIALGIILLLGFSFIRQPWSWVALSVALYLAAFAWETRLATEASVTRLLILGLTLVVLMIKRPQGILGKRRVTIV